VWGVGGTSLVEFSKRFAEFQHVNHVLPVANGTVAIEMALEALDIRCGDEVIVPDYTFVATAMAPLRLGIKPILVDVDPGTFNINPDLVEAAITGKTRAILPVHFGGHPCDMKQIMSIAPLGNPSE
jgi:dTDP-4-amino-4,6-dideoxygalactose transaminase